jgi:hypothetical protein
VGCPFLSSIIENQPLIIRLRTRRFFGLQGMTASQGPRWKTTDRKRRFLREFASQSLIYSHLLSFFGLGGCSDVRVERLGFRKPPIYTSVQMLKIGSKSCHFLPLFAGRGRHQGRTLRTVYPIGTGGLGPVCASPGGTKKKWQRRAAKWHRSTRLLFTMSRGRAEGRRQGGGGWETAIGADRSRSRERVTSSVCRHEADPQLGYKKRRHSQVYKAAGVASIRARCSKTSSFVTPVAARR